jgi:exodeoxyribonuclease VII small subunit
VSEPASFEELQRELEEIVGRLERGDVPVDEAIRLWQRGEDLYRRCAAVLEAAEGRVEELAAQARDSSAPER